MRRYLKRLYIKKNIFSGHTMTRKKMLQVGLEPTTFALRSMYIHVLYKSDALPN